MNVSGGPVMLAPPAQFAPVLPAQVSYPNQRAVSIVGPQPSFYDPGLYPRRRPVRICRRHRRSRRCRPVIEVIESSSCSSLSTCTTISSCSPRRHYRSCSHSRRRCAITPQQQPIIILPMQCQQPPTVPVHNPIQQQPQQVILPPIQIQQPGQLQQQHLALPAIQLNSSNLIPSTNSSPIIIPAGQSMIQSSMSLPQIANIAQPQQIQAGPIQYVQAIPQSSSPLQYISAAPRSTIAPQRVLVNSINGKPSGKTKTIPRCPSTRDLPQNDLKYGRRPFDWYDNDKNNIINENIRIGQRGNTAVS